MRTTLPSGTPAEIVRTDGATRTLVVIPDIMGLRPLFDGMVERLAAETGCSVVAFELWPGREDLPLEQRLGEVGSLEDSRVLGDAIAAADLAGTESAAVLGFCMGGMYTFKAAGTGRFSRAVSFYGMIHVPDQWKSPTQSDPLASLRSSESCPVLAIVGTADQWTPPHDVDELASLPGVTVVRYEGRDHGFVHDPDRPAHDPADAADAWARALEFLTS